MSAEIVNDLMPGTVPFITWGGSRDDEGHREYVVQWKIRTTDYQDGPATVMQCPGLPVVGTLWNFGNDSDNWAFCHPYMSIKADPTYKDGERVFYWIVEQKFSTRPLKRCQDTQIDNPIMEPQKISGGFTKYTQEAVTDRFGNYILTSSFERFTGNLIEFDANRPTVKIEQNVTDLGLEIFAQYVDAVNDAPLWGLPARCVKLSNVAWERKLYGSCSYYFTRSFEFDINFNTFDRDLREIGTMVLNGILDPATGTYTIKDVAPGVPANPNNPQHFIRYKDKTGEAAPVVLNGSGLPADTRIIVGTGSGSSGSIGIKHVEKYSGLNMLVLGIPSTLV